ncbi:MAG: hypothetical protein ABL958_00690 [Bdellovibrionia bacterium]
MGKLAVIFLVGALGIWWTASTEKFSEIKRPFIPPPTFVDHIHFGYKEPMADLLWVRLIQDLGACRVEGETQDLPADSVQSCELGWSYRMADAVTKLAPKFYIVYESAGLMLSIVGGDPKGASLIFERGTENFPDDWKLNYKAAYHELIERKNYSRAAELLKRAGDHGAPPWVYSLAARLYGREGQIDLARQVLNEFLDKNPEGYGAARARQRLKEIEAGLIGDKEVIDDDGTSDQSKAEKISK